MDTACVKIETLRPVELKNKIDISRDKAIKETRIFPALVENILISFLQKLIAQKSVEVNISEDGQDVELQNNLDQFLSHSNWHNQEVQRTFIHRVFMHIQNELINKAAFGWQSCTCNNGNEVYEWLPCLAVILGDYPFRSPVLVWNGPENYLNVFAPLRESIPSAIYNNMRTLNRLNSNRPFSKVAIHHLKDTRSDVWADMSIYDAWSHVLISIVNLVNSNSNFSPSQMFCKLDGRATNWFINLMENKTAKMEICYGEKNIEKVPLSDVLKENMEHLRDL